MAQDSLMLYWPCGVGKTAASVAITQAWRAETPMRVITVTKAGTRAQFRREIERLTYQKPMILEGRNASMIDRRASWVVTSWEILPDWIDEILKWGPTIFIADEIHSVKNKGRWSRVIDRQGKPQWKLRENRVGAAYRLSRWCPKRLGLTATPISRNRACLWGQLDILEPGCWGTFREFAYRYCDGREGTYGGLEAEGKSNTEEFKHRLMRSMHLVDSGEAAKHLPPLRTQTVYLDASDQCRPLGEAKSKLRQIAKNPMGFREYKLSEAASRKRKWVAAQVEEAWEHGSKVTVFLGRRKVVESMADQLRKLSYKFVTQGLPEIPVFSAHGGNTDKQRDEALQRYVNYEGPCVFVGSYQAFGEAYDGFQCTDLAIQAMLPTTPRETLQARGRFRRLGGNSTGCLILYPVAEGTVDEHVASILLSRLEDVVDIGGDTDVTRLVESLGLEDAEEELLANILAT